MESDRQSAARNLRHVLVSQSLVLVSLVISLVLSIARGGWVPWGLIILAVVIALVARLLLLAHRLRQLGRGTSGW